MVMSIKVKVKSKWRRYKFALRVPIKVEIHGMMTMIILGARRKKLRRVLKLAVKISELCCNHEAQLREWNLQTSGFMPTLVIANLLSWVDSSWGKLLTKPDFQFYSFWGDTIAVQLCTDNISDMLHLPVFLTWSWSWFWLWLNQNHPFYG